MITPSSQRGRYILGAIRDEAQRMDAAGYGTDYTCHVSGRQFIEVRTSFGSSLIHWESGAPDPWKATTFVVGRRYGICLINDGPEREGVKLDPGIAFDEWRRRIVDAGDGRQ
jgi:hypothetical protein